MAVVRVLTLILFPRHPLMGGVRQQQGCAFDKNTEQSPARRSNREPSGIGRLANRPTIAQEQNADGRRRLLGAVHLEGEGFTDVRSRRLPRGRDMFPAMAASC